MLVPKLGFDVSGVINKGLTTKEDIEDIQKWRKDKWPQFSDEQVALFLIACNNRHDFTKITMEKHIKIKSSSALFKNRNVKNQDLRDIAKVLNFSVMPEKYQDNVIFVLNIKDSDYRNYCQEAHFKLYFMVIDSIVYDDPPRKAITILDTKGSTWMHVTKMRLSLIKDYSEYFNHGLHLSFKKIHFINITSGMSCCLNLTKPFMNSEVQERTNFHTMSDKYEIPQKLSIPSKYLPEEYGGDLKSVEYYHKRTMEKLEKMQSYFDAEEQQLSALC